MNDYNNVRTPTRSVLAKIKRDFPSKTHWIEFHKVETNHGAGSRPWMTVAVGKCSHKEASAENIHVHLFSRTEKQAERLEQILKQLSV